MEIKLNANLPFSWCNYCKGIDLEREELKANGEVIERSWWCQNAKICETMAKAIQEETTNMIPQSVRTSQQTNDGLRRLILRLEAVLPEPGLIQDSEKWVAEVERQLRGGLEQAIRDLKEKGWRGEKA